MGGNPGLRETLPMCARTTRCSGTRQRPVRRSLSNPDLMLPVASAGTREATPLGQRPRTAREVDDQGVEPAEGPGGVGTLEALLELGDPQPPVSAWLP